MDSSCENARVREWPEKIKLVDKRRYLIKSLGLSCLPDAIAMRKNEVEIAKLQQRGARERRGVAEGGRRGRRRERERECREQGEVDKSRKGSGGRGQEEEVGTEGTKPTETRIAGERGREREKAGAFDAPRRGDRVI